MTSMIPMSPASRVWFRNCSPSVAEICSLDTSAIGNGSEPNLRTVTSSLASFAGKPAEPAAGDLTGAVRDRAVDDRGADDPLVEGDREVVPDVLRRVLGEQLGAGLGAAALEHEVHGQAALVRPGRWLPTGSGRR